MELENNMSYLTKKVIDHRVQGHTIEETADLLGVDVEDVVKEWQRYITTRREIPKEEQAILHILRLEDLLKRVNDKLMHSPMAEIKDYEVVLKIFTQIEELQSLNLSRKEVAEAEADKMYRLQAEQLLGVLEMAKLMMRGMIEEAFEARTLKAAKSKLLEDLGEFNDRALEQLEAGSED